MSRHDEIKASYKTLGKSFSNMYDGIITRSTLLGKLMDSLIWGLNAGNAAKWVNDALSPIQDGFSGKLLEVPVGTGVLTVPVYKTMPDAKITCLFGGYDEERRKTGVSNVSAGGHGAYG